MPWEVSSSRQGRATFWRRQVPSWNEEESYLSGTHDLGQKEARTSRERSEDFKRHMGWIAKEKMLPGPCGSFKIWLQIPWHFCHQKVGAQSVQSVAAFDQWYVAEVMLNGVWGQTKDRLSASSFPSGLPQGHHIVRKPKLHEETMCPHSSYAQPSSSPGPSPRHVNEKASGDSTPRHSQLFKSSHRRPQTLWSREKPTSLHPV